MQKQIRAPPLTPGPYTGHVHKESKPQTTFTIMNIILKQIRAPPLTPGSYTGHVQIDTQMHRHPATFSSLPALFDLLSKA